jgi:hypothetical protein
MSYLEVAITVYENFEYDVKGAGPTEALNVLVARLGVNVGINDRI